jgi:beta-mannanase
MSSVRVALVAMLAAAALLVVQLSGHSSSRPHGVPAVSAAGARVDLGVTTPSLALNEWRRWTPASLTDISAFEDVVHHHVSVVMWYADWLQAPPSLSQLRAVAARGSLPEITWEPWDPRIGLRRPQPRFTLASILDHRHDAEIRRWAAALAAYRAPVRLRLAQEMNGNWYPWDEGVNGNQPGQFVRVWRHVHRLFDAVGARNVQWVWSPVATTVKAEQYPGDRYVDLVGLSGFNGGAQLRYDRWRSFGQLFGPALAVLHRIAPTRPVEISEVGVAGQGAAKAAWIAGMFRYLARTPAIVSVVWFDLDKLADWRVESSSSSERAFTEGLSSPLYR